MKILVISDIHGNIDALMAVDAWRQAQSDPIETIWCLGDLVDYGPAPEEVVRWVRAHANLVVRGNHDHAMGTGEDCRSAPAYHELSVVTREFFRPWLTSEEQDYLALLPMQVDTQLASGARVVLVHASPRDPLFGYVPTTSTDEEWKQALEPAGRAAFVLVGHTHDQFERRIGETHLVNPGSVGLPKDGDPRANFAVLDGDRVELHRVAYDTERAAARVEDLALAARHRQRLAHLLRHAVLPER